MKVSSTTLPLGGSDKTQSNIHMVKHKTRRKSYYRTLTPPATMAGLELELANNKVTQQQIEAKIENRRKEEVQLLAYKERIATLPGQFGVKDVAAVLDLIKRSGVVPPSNRRFKVTPEKEKEILALFREKKTGREIREITGLSFPTLYKVKDKHGLVLHRQAA
jgi:hypothetical protein